MRRLLAVLFVPTAAAAQLPATVAQERADFSHWLLTSPVSPAATLARRAVGDSLTLGPASADIPLAGVAPSTVLKTREGLVLRAGPRRERIAGPTPTTLGGFRLLAGRAGGEPVLLVFGNPPRKPPVFFPYVPELVFLRPLAPTPATGQRILTADGQEADAVEVGTVTVAVGGRDWTLRVMRVPVGEDDESELQINFRDATNDRGSYPAGRFVTVDPVANGQLRIDFNRARNPFCAYSSAYPCPLPWRGNLIEAPVRAGEKYAGGGLSSPALPAD